LTLVGGRGNGEKEVLGKVASSEWGYVKIVPHVADREMLRKIYEAHDIFVMVSQKETFGVVYLEALSQGLPIIYTRGQGIDGYFKEGEVGYSVNPTNINGIVSKIKRISSDQPRLSEHAIEKVKEFQWADLAEKYLKIYCQID
jgi:glycosyltransferase involved in cell wall biosynthesis